MKVKQFLCVLLLCLAFAPLQCETAGAGVYDTIESSSPQKVVNGMSSKAVRGMANVSTGWMEFPKQIYLSFREDGVASGLFVGPLKGIGMTLVRTVAGFGELTTFFIAAPGFYDPYFDPAFVWQKE